MDANQELNIMNSMKNRKIKTVTVNARGQIVIPEDVRKDFGIVRDSTLVLIERDSELVLKRGADVLTAMEAEDRFWQASAIKAMKRAWSKEDAIWDELFEESSK